MAEPTSTPHSRDFELVRQAIGPDPGRPPYPETSLGHLATEAINRIEEQFESLLTTTERLFQMIDRETWRSFGGDDGQGHYEGDYYAERIEQELVALRASFPAMSPEADR